MKGQDASNSGGNGTAAGWIGVVLGMAAVPSVLAFGGVEPISFAFAQVAVVVLAAVVFWRQGFPPLSFWPSCVLGILLLIPLVQLIPLPRSVIAALSPARAALLDNLSALGFAVPETVALTVNSYETQFALLRVVCYVLVFLLAFDAYRRRREPTALVVVLIGIGIFEAVYGSVQYLTGWQYIFTYRKEFNTEEATGTYINRNHFAGLLEMVLPFLLAGILFRKWGHGSNRRSAWVEIIVSPLSSRLLRDLVLFALVFVALIFSRSRMGITAAMAGILTVGLLAFYQRRHRATLPILLLILTLPIAYSLWIGITPVVGRFELLTQSDVMEQGRLFIWRDTFALLQDYPLLGTGLGTYHWASRHYQSFRFDLVYGHAHNDYLEVAADLGIPAALLLFVSLWVLVVKVARRSMVRERASDRTVAAGCAGAMTAILVHAIADFNLQIPANAYIFSWIAGTAYGLVCQPLRPGRGGAPEQGPSVPAVFR